MDLVIDAAWGWPDLAAAKSDGYTGIIGYLCDDPSKRLTAARVAQAHGLGMTVGVVWEDGASDLVANSPAWWVGAGQRAAAQSQQLGLPVTTALYVAADYNAPSTDFAKIASNLGEFATHCGGHPVGIYGHIYLVDWMLDHSYARYGFQAAAWSGGAISSKAHLYQRIQHTRPPIAGSYDEDVVLKTDWGAWTPPVPTSAVVTVPTVPTPPKEIDMILVAVAKGPNGENPGIFLASAGALHHVASMADVAAYQKAGVPGPVTISFADYQNYVAEEKARVPVIPATVTTITPEEITTAVETAFQAEASKIATLPMP